MKRIRFPEDAAAGTGGGSFFAFERGVALFLGLAAGAADWDALAFATFFPAGEETETGVPTTGALTGAAGSTGSASDSEMEAGSGDSLSRSFNLRVILAASGPEDLPEATGAGDGLFLSGFFPGNLLAMRELRRFRADGKVPESKVSEAKKALTANGFIVWRPKM